MLTKLKQKVQEMLAVEAKAARRIGLTPNRISGLGIVFALLTAIAYARWQEGPFYLAMAIILLLLSGFCDALDGVVARLYRQTTAFGGFLDSLLDRYADAAIYTAIIVSGLCWPLWGLIALTGSLLVSYSRARAEAANVRMESVGIAERAERIIILVVASLIAIYWQPKTVINAAVIFLAVLTNLTVAQRGLYAYKRLKKEETGSELESSRAYAHVPFLLSSNFYDSTMHSTGNAVKSRVRRGSYVCALLAKLFCQGRVNERNPASRPFSLVAGDKLSTTGTLNNSAAALTAFGPSPTLTFKRQSSNTS